MNIKICGITTIADAIHAAQAGATHLGLNFYPKSPRYLHPEAAGDIAQAIRSLPAPPVLVGVFVNAELQSVQKLLSSGIIDLAQLHGDEPAEYQLTLGAQAYKAYRVRAGEQIFPIQTRTAPTLLVDASVAGAYGGTGQSVDFPTAQALARQFDLFLAGGLTPENVLSAIRAVQPWGVDTASGVESAPGKKDPAKVTAFIQQALSI
ncbi:MAG TPA: phosphoribosylanthranilate isomerase [Anaerolineales bacterium]|nr:phosphoribosylanthranilate isomerase [Anaerolineales bacterium]